MLKAVLLGFVIMIGLWLIPIVHFISGPISPFIAGYFAINRANPESGSYAMKGLIFGSLLGLIVFLVSTTIAVILMVTAGEQGLGQKALVLIWGLGVGLATLYVGSLSALGAMYSVLRSRSAVTTTAATDVPT